MEFIAVIIVIILIAVMAILYSSKSAKKKAENRARLAAEEAQRRAEAARAAEEKRKKNLELVRIRKEEEDRKKALFAEKERILQSPTLNDYLSVEESSLGFDLSLPKVSSNVYFLGRNATLTDATRGLLVARFKDLGKYLIDLDILKRISSEVLHYWFPSNSFIAGEPVELYNTITSQLPSDSNIMLFIRFDSSIGFLLYTIEVSDFISASKKMASYILYHANGFSHPGEGFFSSESIFKTTPTPVSLPVIKKKDYDSGIRFSISNSSPSYDSDIRFRISGNDTYGGNARGYRAMGNNIDALLSSVNTNAPKPAPVKKTTDEKYDDEVKKMLEETLENIQKLQLNGVSLNLIQALIGKTTRLSEIRITKNYKIILTDFNNLEIDLNPLQTTVYLLFLNHPEGISFYDLPDHKKELMNIYGRITGRSDLVAIKQSIDSLIDRFDGSISTQCSRIRKAFISVLAEDIAKNYYIDGKQGEAKVIAIPRSYVRRDDLGNAVANFNTSIALKGKEYMNLIEASNFKSFKDLSFLLRPLENIEFRRGYVPDAFWCGTKDDRYMKFYACHEGSERRYPVYPADDSILPFDDSMFLEGIYSEKQASFVPKITDYIKVDDSIGVWEAYLLAVSEMVVPHLKSSSAERRRYVFSHRDLVEILGANRAEAFRSDNGVVPVVETIDNMTSRIICCYASSTRNGLCREYIQAESRSSSVVFTTERIEMLSEF